ncbi:hypothetical protein [Mycolicibacterium moriokaense]|uniref:Uncharacterized protein n=1 Tax=Mycolicibacterium moriokaense TaxID=39691 RepID=A0A318HD64_9MYCO|nr:hypothetical protein [Mycolicibacterium moriokaense]PXX06349.1 hypothetical protein C8E89_114122 [Mycolicibacterium moriokaense]
MRKIRCVRVLGALISTTAAFAACLGLSVPKAQAFFIQNHETITRAALPQIPSDVMLQILVGPPPGAGAVGTDAFFTDDYRHLDNARNPTDMCALALQAWNTFDPLILSGSHVVGGGLADGPGARAAFGALIHVQQDFYAHSNFVEDNVAAGNPNQLAPPIFPTCNPGAFPADLHTGYFDTSANHEDPFSGCPAGGPPPGFPECHATLNKDGPNTLRGIQPAAGTSGNLFDLAAQLATTATANLYNQIRSQVAHTNGDKAAQLLFGSGGTTNAGK